MPSPLAPPFTSPNTNTKTISRCCCVLGQRWMAVSPVFYSLLWVFLFFCPPFSFLRVVGTPFIPFFSYFPAFEWALPRGFIGVLSEVFFFCRFFFLLDNLLLRSFARARVNVPSFFGVVWLRPTFSPALLIFLVFYAFLWAVFLGSGLMWRGVPFFFCRFPPLQITFLFVLACIRVCFSPTANG